MTSDTYKKKVVISANRPNLKTLSSKEEKMMTSRSTQGIQIPKNPSIISPLANTGSQTSSNLSIPNDDSTKTLLGKRDWLKRFNHYLGSAGNQLGLTDGIKELELCTLINSYTSKSLSLMNDLPEGAVEFENVCTHNLSKNEKFLEKLNFLNYFLSFFSVDMISSMNTSEQNEVESFAPEVPRSDVQARLRNFIKFFHESAVLVSTSDAPSYFC